jgi:uroporphyrinogen decarboxylase
VDPLVVRAARLEPVERTPVWFMRQAGRSLPGYREIRKRHSLFEVCRKPELCTEVTLEPVRVHGVDAAVMFADIMLPVLGMGVDVDLVENVGPVIEHPVRTAADVEALRVPDPEEAVPFILEAVRLVRAELEPEQALVGFCGGPFTVAGYLVEGRPTRDFVQTKRLMYGAPAVWHALMEKLTEMSIGYLRAKVEAGVDVVQLFDSWIGALSLADYVEFVSPYSQRILSSISAPTIHFGTGTQHLRGTMTGDVIGIDWRSNVDEVLELGRGVQGNLDPTLLLGPFSRVEEKTLEILTLAGGRPGHIFNLGHGVLPDTDPAHLRRLVELVHERTATVAA